MRGRDRLSSTIRIFSPADQRRRRPLSVTERTSIWETALYALKVAFDENKNELDSYDDRLADAIDTANEAIGGFSWVMDVYSPLAIDLNGDGIETINHLDMAGIFDFNLGVEVTSHGWLSPDDGFLAWDRNMNGKIDDASELLGGRTLDGFSQLSLFDDNGDGAIDVNDAIWAELLIWQDTNSDTVSQHDELSYISDRGVTSLILSADITTRQNNGNLVLLESFATSQSGEMLEFSDVYFRIATSDESLLSSSSSDSKVVFGTSADDLVLGSAEDQIFFGGSGSDTFVFNENSGSDIIYDFDLTHDKLDLREWGEKDTLTAEVTDDGLLISGACGSVLLLGIAEYDGINLI